jgi:hypothetical protein
MTDVHSHYCTHYTLHPTQVQYLPPVHSSPFLLEYEVRKKEGAGPATCNLHTATTATTAVQPFKPVKPFSTTLIALIITP